MSSKHNNIKMIDIPMNKEPIEPIPRSRREVYDKIFEPTLAAIEEPRGGAEYLVALGEDMDSQSDSAKQADKVRAIELLLRNLVNLGNYNPNLFKSTNLNPLIADLVESTEKLIGLSPNETDLHDRLAQLQVSYADATEFADGHDLGDDYFQKHLGVQAFAFNAADQLGASAEYYRGNIASAVSQVYTA